MKKKILFRSVLSSFFLAIILIFIGLKIFFLDSRMVTSGSMSDTLKHGDYIISWRLNLSRLAARPGEGTKTGLKRKDIILCKLPGEREILIKRIIGLPGDIVELTAAGIFINGSFLEEPYAKPFTVLPVVCIYRIPANQLFLLGDNRPFSRDSRKFGLVDTGCVIGKVFFCYYPFNRCRWFR